MTGATALPNPGPLGANSPKRFLPLSAITKRISELLEPPTRNSRDQFPSLGNAIIDDSGDVAKNNQVPEYATIFIEKFR